MTKLEILSTLESMKDMVSDTGKVTIDRLKSSILLLVEPTKKDEDVREWLRAEKASKKK